MRDFSYIAPDIPEYKPSNCTGCMDCVTLCPDTAILGKVVGETEFQKRIEQVPEFGAASKRKALASLAWLDSELGRREYLAGDRFTIADITALVAIDFGRVTGIRIAPEQRQLAAWHARVSARPSARA